MSKQTDEIQELNEAPPEQPVLKLSLRAQLVDILATSTDPNLTADVILTLVLDVLNWWAISRPVGYQWQHAPLASAAKEIRP